LTNARPRGENRAVMRPVIRVVLATLVAGALATCSSGEVGSDRQERLDAIRKATEKYKDLNLALGEGFRPLVGCAESADGDGARGLAYVDLRRFRDEKVELLKPEMLFYEPKPRGKPPELVGVGYYVPDNGQAPPEIPLGHFDGPVPGGFRGFPEHYELHAWVHRENPEGVLAVWNPDVKCT
jgi:hypothetical protein